MVPAKAFDIAQVQEAQPETPVALAGGEAQQPVGNILIFIGQYGLIAIATLTDLEHLASQTDGYGVMGQRPWSPFPGGQMASPLFCHCLGDDLGHEALLSIHLLEAAVFVLQHLETSHEGGIHPAEFGAPLVESGRDDAMLAAELRDRRANLGLSPHPSA